ncbi:MAG TPA: T9SS type A sorting domain-containing protein [Bacteroidales bacterium]|nr:T9SS type A sorting domain-containing protein [Bacteroidales bacterium]
MKRLALFGTILFVANTIFCQVQTLQRIGQTPGGAGYHTNWDSATSRLIVCCGTSIWVYDFSDPENPQIVAKRPLTAIVNETDVYGDILFAAATHDGVYALDFNSPDLDILHQYNMKEMGDSAAYDMWRENDTLYVADNHEVRVLKYYNETGFTLLNKFGGPSAYCVSRRGNIISVGNKGNLLSDGKIQIFSVNNLNTPIAVWTSTLINFVQDVQFADLNDSIIYVCGGPENVLFTESNFFALQYDGTNLVAVDTFELTGGVPGIAQLNIMNMDSRNDTLFVVTTAAYDLNTLPLSYMPIIDATALPVDTMKQIGYVIPGLWHFDAALMHQTPYIAMSSEWLGVLISDVSELAPNDTLCLLDTGGWCLNNKIFDNKLYACHEGWGMAVYDIDSLLFENGFHADSRIMHIHDLNDHYFSSDVEMLNDSLMMTNSSKVYNLNTWTDGNNPVIEYDMNINWIVGMKNLFTEENQYLLLSFDNLTGGKWIEIRDPFDSNNNYPTIFIDSTYSDPKAIAVSGDTIYYSKKIENNRYFYAGKIIDDEFQILDSIMLTMTWGALSTDDAHSISIENGIIAVGYGPQFALFNWNNNELNELFTDFNANQRIFGIVLKNNYIYVADRFYGVKIYDVSSQTEAVLVAQARGTGGWTNLFGSNSISVSENGTIFLSDFHGGVYIYEIFDHSLPQKTRQNQDIQATINIHPNPATDRIVIEISSVDIPDIYRIKITDITGRQVYSSNQLSENKIVIYTSKWQKGMYNVTVYKDKGVLATKKFIVI